MTRENPSESPTPELRATTIGASAGVPDCVKTFRGISVSEAEWRCKKPKSPFSQGSQSGKLKIGLNLAWMGGGRAKKAKKWDQFALTEGSHQALHPQNIQHPPDVIGQGGQAELSPDLLEATHQKMAMIPPELQRAEGVLDQLLALFHNL